jgi:hypothetical protein
MTTYPLHNQPYFYKYTSINTAKKILIGRKFRYSSPLLFNDPFDTQTELLFDYEIDSFPLKLFDEIEKLASSGTKIEFQEKSLWRQSIELLRYQIINEGKLNLELKNSLLLEFSKLIPVFEETRKEYNKKWHKSLKAMRVFSVSLNNNDILMWSHYGQNHTGMVFKLKVLPEVDNLLCIAEPIIYKPLPWTFFTLQDWIKNTLGLEKTNRDALFRNYAKTKYELWKYEEEWRVWSFDWDSIDKSYHASDNNNIPKEFLYNDYNIIPEEIDEIYFGCNTSKVHINEIQALGNNINKNIKYYKAHKVIGKYKLEFTAI